MPAPDVMTSGQHMVWMLDEFETIHGTRLPGFITGKPVGMGGSAGRIEATGYGWMTEAFRSVYQRAEDEAVSLRDTAYLIAVDRVARACRERGWV